MTDKDEIPPGDRDPVASPGPAQHPDLYTAEGEPRERGIFTHADREHIIGEREYSTPQQRSNKRQKKVQRIEDAMHDFELLLGLDDLTKQRVFEDAARPFLHQTLGGIIRFYYEGTGRDTEFLEYAITSAVWASESGGGMHELNSVTTDISIDRPPDPDVAKDLVEKGEYHNLTLEQIGILARKGMLDSDDWERLGPAMFASRDDDDTDES